MARDVRSFSVLVPAGTLDTSPVVADLNVGNRIVTGVRVRIPPGPRGTVGWALGAAGTRILPSGPDEWIIGDDDAIEWPLSDQIESGAWQCQAYNLGTYDHALYVTFLLDLPGASGLDSTLVPLTVTP